MENQDGVPVIAMNIRLELECLARRCLELLISRSNGEMRLSKFMERFNTHFDDHANLVEVKHSLFPAIIVCDLFNMISSMIIIYICNHKLHHVGYILIVISAKHDERLIKMCIFPDNRGLQVWYYNPPSTTQHSKTYNATSL